jgi:hypothetical protein
MILKVAGQGKGRGEVWGGADEPLPIMGSGTKPQKFFFQNVCMQMETVRNLSRNFPEIFITRQQRIISVWTCHVSDRSDVDLKFNRSSTTTTGTRSMLYSSFFCEMSSHH